MKKFEHLREKALCLRKDGKSLNDICEMLNRSKTTVYYWIKDVEIINKNAFLNTRKQKINKAQKNAALSTRRKFKLLHDVAREEAIKFWEENKEKQDFILFVMLYWCEGYKRTKHTCSVVNSDHRLMKLALKWLSSLSKKKVNYEVRLHEDQNEQGVVNFWKNELNITEEIKTLKKSNSGKMKGRNWNSKNGLLEISVYDAYLKTKIDTWIDFQRELIDSL